MRRPLHPSDVAATIALAVIWLLAAIMAGVCYALDIREELLASSFILGLITLILAHHLWRIYRGYKDTP